MKVQDIMTNNLITCAPDDNILFVSNLMKIWDVGFVLIMNKGDLYGVVTDRDLVCDMANQLEQIKSYASRRVVTVDKNQQVSMALEIMKKSRVKRLVVMDDDVVCGVVSLSDIYNADIDSLVILDALQSIFAIDRNEDVFETDVDAFPL